MEPNKNINGEDLLREKMLEEEFPFEPEAWAKMEDLLDRRQHPVPPPPGPSSGNNGSNRLFRWLALLLLLLMSGWYLYERSGDTAGNNMAVSSALEKGNRKTGRPVDSGKSATSGAGNRRSTPQQQTSATAAETMAGDTDPLPDAVTAAAAESSTTNSFSELNSVQVTTTAETNTVNARVHAGGHATVPPPLAPATAATETAVPAANQTATTYTETTETSPTTIQTDAAASAPQSETTTAVEASAGLPQSEYTAYTRMSAADKLETVLIPLDDIIRPVQLKQFDVQPKNRRVLLIGYGLGFNAALPQFGLSQVKYAPHISLATRYNFNQKLALRTEISLRKVDGYALSATFSDSTFRPTGELLWYNYQPGTPGFMFVDMPVLLTYKLGNSRSAAMLGLRPALVFPSDQWLTQSGNYTPPQGLNDVSQGIRRFDLAATIGWEFHLAPRFYVDVRYSQGWYDLSHDNFFQNTQTHLSSDIQVSFRHFFTQK